MKKGRFLLVFFIFFSVLSFSQVYIPPGDVSGVWGISDSLYYIQGDITIPNDSTLIINPGVQVMFLGHYALNVQGQLLAVGNETDKIAFTIDDTTGFHNPDIIQGGWNGIQFIDTPIGNDTSKIIYCKLQYGKAVGFGPPDNSGGAIFISNFNKVIISNSLISYNSAGGTDSPTGGGLSLRFANIRLLDNEISYNHAWDGGGIQIWESYVVFSDNIIKQNYAIEGGGGIWVGGNSGIEFSNDNIIENIAGNNGGGMVCWQTPEMTLISANLCYNTANWGGGVAIFSGQIQMDSCLISGNGSNNSGGGIGSDLSTIILRNTTIEKDTASVFGGAIEVYNSDLYIRDCNLTDNGAGVRGGAIHSDFSSVYILNTTFERDTANIFGGAIATEHTEMFLNGCNLIDNSARILGGGIHSDYSTIDISNTTFERDTTGNTGGGIFTWQSSLNIEGSEFINNSALNNGGAVSSSNCRIFIDSCTFYQNLAGNEAGAIECFIDTSFFTEKLSIEIINSEFLYNTSANLFAGVKIRQDNSDTSLCSVRMDNNLFRGNSAYSYSAIRFIGNIDDIVVNNSIFEANYATQFTSIFSANGGAKVKANNCLFTKNYPRAVSLNINARIDFMNCTIANNYGAKSSALSIRNNAESTITNTILWNNGNNPIVIVNVGTNGSILTVNHSDIQFGPDSLIVPDSLSILNWGIGNIDDDPLFVDTLINDFHLQDSSPCIAAGIDSIEIGGLWHHSPSTDIEGNPRPNPTGTKPDMGAYESQFPVRVGDEHSDLPINYALFQNYPNPFNPITKIKFQIPEFGFVNLKVYDVLGNEVMTLVDEYRPAGNYEVEFDGHSDEGRNLSVGRQGLSSGVYFYQLKISGPEINSGLRMIQTKKMILIK